MIQLYHKIIHYDLGKTCYKMSISEEIKSINNKIDQKKAQYNLDIQTAKISVLSLENVSKYESLNNKDVLPEKDLLEKAVALKRSEYSPLGTESKAQTSVVEKHDQKLNMTFMTFESDDEEEEPLSIKKENLGTIHESKIIYNNKYTFSKYRNVRKYMDDFPNSKYNRLAKFYNQLN